ncbi:MAG: squalene synthase HpnC [Bryobacterales bacterium]|nr:squalene synthase HpnC [Bryobacterales bacterium]
MATRNFLAPAAFLEDPASQSPWELDESLRYTRWLATGHYENFHVVSLLLPRELHQDFYNVYAYCRWSDDLGDELGNPARSVKMLAWWRAELEAMYAGTPPAHPVFIALAGTVRRRDLPIEPFMNLLDAFLQDQTVTRYQDWAEIEAYCVNSANPVGRLVLMLCGYRDEARFLLSDAVCTGLQLANFWQDVLVDLGKGRIYLPLDLVSKHGYSEEQLLSREDCPAFRGAMREAVDHARGYFERGQGLVFTLNPRLALDIDLFIRGGVAILDEVQAIDYAVLRQRPRIGRLQRGGILFRALAAHIPRLWSAPKEPASTAGP